MALKKILFYSNSSIVGGHELMCIEIVKQLQKRYTIFFLISKHNIELQKILRDMGIDPYLSDYKANNFQILRNYISLFHFFEIRSYLKKIKPDLVFLIQGNIELSLNAAIYARFAKIPCISYIPLSQSLRKVSSNKVIGVIKDFFRSILYSIPDKYITISETQKKYLEAQCNKKVYILHNYINCNNLQILDKNKSKTKINLSNSLIVGYIGRFEYWHKGLDKYIDFLNSYAKDYIKVTFLFIGDGPAKDDLMKLQLRNTNVKVISWTNELSTYYSAMDCLIMPSRFEGVSLTMLEGMHYNLPIIANDIPEFREFINDNNLFNICVEKEWETIINKVLNNQLTPSTALIKYESYDIFTNNIDKIMSSILSALKSTIKNKYNK